MASEYITDAEKRIEICRLLSGMDLELIVNIAWAVRQHPDSDDRRLALEAIEIERLRRKTMARVDA